MFIVTREWMDEYRSPGGGFLAVQLRQLGEKYPLTAGWMQRCIGKEITDEQKRIFEAGAVSKSHARKVAKDYRKLSRNKSKTNKYFKDYDLCIKYGWVPEKDLVVEKQPKIYRLPKKQKIEQENKQISSDAFLMSFEWRRLRMQALKKYGSKCMCCGATPESGAIMNVDHIKPRKLFPSLALDINNLQILCHECNHGKGNWDMTDWRKKEQLNG